MALLVHPLVPDLLWTDFDSVSMAGLPMGRRMAVARNAHGRSVVFSPLPASEGAFARLRSAGEPLAFVVPSRLHDRYYAEYVSAFPNALFLGSAASASDHPRWPITPFARAANTLDGFDMVKVEGMPNVQEHVFFHRATRTLIIADLLFNLPVSGGLLTRTLLWVADMGGRPRPSRLWRTMIRRRPEFIASLVQIRQWDFARIVPGHGEVIGDDAKQIFNAAFAAWQ